MLTRLQFAATASFHISFPCLIIGLAYYLMVLEILWLRKKQPIYLIQYQFWAKIFAATFIIGVITGVVLSYQLDTIFANLYYKTRNILVPIREIERFSTLFLASGFFGIMVWGWQRVGQRLHFLATLMVTLGVTASSVCIIARNSWMQTPDGFLSIDHQLMVDDWLSILISPSFPYRFFHMLGAAFLSTALFVMGISAWFLLKQRHREFARFSLRAALLVVSVLTPIQLFLGDLHGLNINKHQPAKLAAIEALWDTTKGAPLVLFALPDSKLETNHYATELPKLGSLIITHDPSGKIIGLKSIPKEQRPNVPLVFFSFRMMVIMGLAIFMAGAIGLILLRTGRLYHSPWFLRICCAMIPSGFIATIAGWWVAEAGRQPWVIYGLLKTAEVAAPVAESETINFLSIIGTAYSVLLFWFVYYLCRVIRYGPDQDKGRLTRPARNGPAGQ